VRDHFRPAFHQAIGLDISKYDFDVFRICSAISCQTFPLTLDIDHPKFKPGLDRLVVIANAKALAKQQGGLWGHMKAAWLSLDAGLTFAKLYSLPSKAHELPAEIRMAPVW
jgi:magnesium-protoporphyrin IX monomethyl ester (oxidative) cyclase